MNKNILKDHRVWAAAAVLLCLLFLLGLFGVARVYAQSQEINQFTAKILQENGKIFVLITEPLGSSEWKIEGEKVQGYEQASRTKDEVRFSIKTDAKDGDLKVSLQQKYTVPLIGYRVRSESKDISGTIDFVPPEGEIKIENLTDITNQKTLKVSLNRTNPDIDSLVVNDKPAMKFEGNKVDTELALNEGDNTFIIKALDSKGNAKEAAKFTIVSDTTAPSISLSLGNLICDGKDHGTREHICIQGGEFFGPLTGTAARPITGKVEGNIKQVTYDGKVLNVDSHMNINQRVSLYVRQGDNNYEIKVVDKAGNESVKIDTLNWSEEYPGKQNDEDIQDRLDDIENKVDDLDR